MYKFSIVIPNYNEEKFIGRCLDSIFSQTIDVSKYEVIVIDDGSCDNSVNIIKEYNVKLLSSNRLGAGGARNKGIDIAKGDYIIILDSDDYLYSNDVLEKLSLSLEGQDIVFVKYKSILENQERLVEENSTNTLEEQIYKSNHFCCTLKCFKNELAKDIRYKENCYHEDISFTMELMCKAKSILYFDEILYVYYKEKNESTTDNYTVRKALDFTNQTLEYLYLADKYKEKRQWILKRINSENYIDKITKLYNWVKNDIPYTYHKFLDSSKNIGEN